MTATSSTIITPRDFLHRTTDRLEFSLGMLRHVIAALDGAPVAITVDTQTGHTLIGVRLIGVFHGGPARGLRVTVESDYSDGTTGRTNYRVVEVGMILPLADSRAKWTALDTYNAEQSGAIAIAQRKATDEGVVAETGRWEARSDEDGVVVSYNPGTPREGQRREQFWYTRVTSAEAAAELAERAVRSAAYRAKWEAEAAAEKAAK